MPATGVSQAERGHSLASAALELLEAFRKQHGAYLIAADAGWLTTGAIEAVGYRERRLKSGEERWVKRLEAE